MGRWDIDDDARPPDAGGSRQPARTEPARVEREIQIRPLPDHVQDRDRDGDRRGRPHALTLPAGRDRELVRSDGRDYRVRGSEVDLLERAGRFRVVFTEDLRRDAGDDARFREDLRSLERQDLLAERTVTRLRDGTVADVVSLTRAGQALLDHHRSADADVGQHYYSGWVKTAEVWHDASLFTMVRAAQQELDADGDHIRRVILDDELKAVAFRALHEAREAGESDAAAHRTVANAEHLALDGDHFVFPDVRLEIEAPDGTVRHLDLEWVTEHYHRGHLGGKASAGFRMFGGASSGRRGGTPHDPKVVGRLFR
jgi:hypothetical protein